MRIKEGEKTLLFYLKNERVQFSKRVKISLIKCYNLVGATLYVIPAGESN